VRINAHAANGIADEMRRRAICGLAAGMAMGVMIVVPVGLAMLGVAGMRMGGLRMAPATTGFARIHAGVVSGAGVMVRHGALLSRG
jgi:hypothetical protein